VTFAPDRAVLRRRDAASDVHGLRCATRRLEIRRVSVTNHSRVIRELELTSYAEMVLAQQGGRSRSPGVQQSLYRGTGIPQHSRVMCSRRPRGHEPRLHAAMCSPAAAGLATLSNSSDGSAKSLGRGGTLSRGGHDDVDALSGFQRRRARSIVSSVRLRVPRVTARVSLPTVVAKTKMDARAHQKYHDPQVSARAFGWRALTAKSSCGISA